jgi:hypothetical protein
MPLDNVRTILVQIWYKTTVNSKINITECRHCCNTDLYQDKKITTNYGQDTRYTDPHSM